MCDFNINKLAEAGSNVIKDIPATYLINKLAKAIHWHYTHNTPEKEGVKAYIEEIKKSNLAPLVKGAFITKAEETINEYVNQNNIVKMAMNMLPAEIHADAVEDDWLAGFMDKARTISSKDCQVIWGKILAGEMEKPGSYSLRTLEKLKNMNKQDAKVFEKLSRIVARRSDNVVCIITAGDILRKHDFSYSDLLLMEECGLLNPISTTATFTTDSVMSEIFICNKSMVGVVRFENDNGSGLAYCNHELTRAGHELLQIISNDEDNDYFIDSLHAIKADWLNKKSNYNISAHKIINIKADGEIEYDNRYDLLCVDYKKVELNSAYV